MAIFSPENFPILYYFIGAGFRKFQYEIKKSVCLFVIALSLALNALEDVIYCQMYLDPFGQHLFTNNFYGNPFTVIVVFMLFALLYKVDTKYECIRKTFQFISSISLEIYCGLPIADIYARALVEKSARFIEAHQLPYILKYVPWVFGELIVTLFIATLVNMCFKMIKKLCVSLRRARAV